MNNGNFSVKIERKKEAIGIPVEDILEVSLLEDINSACMIGSLSFIDKSGFTELFDVHGQDNVVISYKEGDEKEVQKIFHVLAPSPIHSDSLIENFKVITWLLVDLTYIYMFNDSKISKPWNNMKGSDIIKDVCKKVGITEFGFFEDTNEKFDNITSTLNNPVEVINWVKKRCSSVNTNLGGYLFYSSSKGYNFVTYPYLFSNKLREKDINGNIVKYLNFQAGSDDINLILGSDIREPLPMMKDKLNGIKVSFVNNNKGYNEITYTFRDLFESNDLGPEFKGFADSVEPVIQYVNSNLSNHNIDVRRIDERDETKIKNMIFSEFLERYLFMLQSRIVVRGSSTRYAGMIIDISWKSTHADLTTDKSMQGSWLVKSIEHKFSPNAMPIYTQVMTCIKPGYSKNTGSGDVKMSGVKDGTTTVTKVK
jgi:hypothetical protein